MLIEEKMARVVGPSLSLSLSPRPRIFYLYFSTFSHVVGKLGSRAGWADEGQKGKIVLSPDFKIY